MLGLVSRSALFLLSIVAAGCSVPTPVGELQPSGANAGATSTTDDAEPTSQSSVSSADSSVSTDAASGSSSGDAIVPTVPEMTSFVIRRGDLPNDDPTDTEDTLGSDVGTGPDGDPDDLLVTFGVTNSSCKDPTASDPCQTWAVTLILPPAQQVTGTYTDGELEAFYSEQGTPDADEICPGTGGSLTGFTIILESIDDSGIELVFEGDGLGPSDVDLNGISVSVPRC